MPVSMSICWDVEDWEAWAFAEPLGSLSELEVVVGREPPSRFRASWILVSFVERLRVVLRLRGSAMVFLDGLQVCSGSGGGVVAD